MKKFSVLITGASTGIGRAIAIDLANRGHQVFAGVRKQADGVNLTNINSSIVPVQIDVTDGESIRLTQKQIERQRIKELSFVLINNAGIAVAGPIEAVEIEEFKKQFAVNVFGLVETTQTFLPIIRETRGRIVNMSSVSGLLVSPFLGPYCASKYAVEAISDALRRELAVTGVKVIVIEPGPIQTPIWEKGLGHRDELFSKINKERLEPYRNALDKFIKQVEQVARAAIPAEEVARSVHEALLADDPPVRQIVTSRLGHLQVTLGHLLPSKWLDRVLKKQLFHR